MFFFIFCFLSKGTYNVTQLLSSKWETIMKSAQYQNENKKSKSWNVWKLNFEKVHYTRQKIPQWWIRTTMLKDNMNGVNYEVSNPLEWTIWGEKWLNSNRKLIIIDANVFKNHSKLHEHRRVVYLRVLRYERTLITSYWLP